MRRALLAVIFAVGLSGPAFAAAGDAVTVDNPEMKAIFDADQAERTAPLVDGMAIMAADAKRQARTRELLAQDLLHTGTDYWEAALIFQHGNTSDSYLLAHVLAMVAMAKGKPGAISMAAATLDRYLMKIGQKQVLGTQFMRPDPAKDWTQEPYDRELISDALRHELNAPSQAEQAEELKEIRERK